MIGAAMSRGSGLVAKVYARVAQVQADANKRYLVVGSGVRHGSSSEAPFPMVPICTEETTAVEQRNRSQELQRCFDKLEDFDDDKLVTLIAARPTFCDLGS